MRQGGRSPRRQWLVWRLCWHSDSPCELACKYFAASSAASAAIPLDLRRSTRVNWLRQLLIHRWYGFGLGALASIQNRQLGAVDDPMG